LSVQQRAAGVDGTFNTSQLDKENQLVKKTIWAAVASLLVVASLGVPAMAAPDHTADDAVAAVNQEG
jgi:hypothetical protein